MHSYLKTAIVSVAVLILLTGTCAAQLTTASALVQDTNGSKYVNCTYVVDFVPNPNQTAPYSYGGNQNFQKQYPNQRCDSFGNLSIQLPDNVNGIFPNDSSWRFSISSAKGYSPGDVYSFGVNVVITGATQNISATLQAAAAILPLGYPFPLTTKGDLFGFGSSPARVPVGADGTCLVANSASPTGLTYGTCGSGGGGGGSPPGGSPGQIQVNVANTSFGGITNLANGAALVSQGTGTPPVFQVKPKYDVRDYGVDCTGVADSTTAFQNLINAVPNFSNIVIPQACKIKVSGSPAITIDSRYGLVFEFGGRQSNNCDQISTSAQLFYNTAYAPGNKILYINRSQRLRFAGLTIITNGGADVPLDVDQVGATPPITTQNVFEDVCILNQAAANPNFVGMRFSNTSISNVEAQHLYRPMVECSNQAATSSTSNGTGIVFGPNNANAVDEIVEDPNFNKCSIDINTGFGDTNFINYGLSSASYINSSLGGFVDGVQGMRSEVATNAVSIVNPIGPHFVANNFFGASAGTRIDCPTGCGKLTMFNNHTDVVPTNWFNVHTGNGSSGPLVAFNNRNFSWASTDWGGGAFVVDTGVITATLPRFFFTPSFPSGNNRGGNIQSPAIDLQSFSGTSVVPDDYVIQALPTGPLSNTPGSSTLVLGHPNVTSFAPWLSFPGTMSGATFGQITNTANLGIIVRGASGSTAYSYVAVAHGSTGTTTASNTGSTVIGNAVLSGSNWNLIQIPMVAGCTYFDVYRTVSAGTPATLGKIGTVDCWYTGSVTTVNASILAFNDTGFAGDGSSPPVANTTGQIISTVATGLPPLVVASTTNIPNLNASTLSGATFAAPGPIGSTTPGTGAFTTLNSSGTATLGSGTTKNIATGVSTNTDLAGSLTMVAGTISYSFTGVYASGPICTATDTTAANPVRVQTTNTTLTITGTGTDVVYYICIGRD